MKKKLLFSLMLSILCILIFGAVNASAATYGDLTYEISNGEVIITDCDTSASGEFVIPSTIGIYPVTSIADCAFEECKKITSITIPNTITYIGKDAFYYCTNIKRVNITNIEDWCNIDFVTAYSNPLAYGYNLYQNDELVTDLVIPDSITNIGRHTFLACQSLTNVTIHDAVTNIDMRAFYACGNLTNITIPDSVIIIRPFAFAHCIKLSTVTIGNSVTNIYNSAFYDCDNLSTVYYNGSEQDWNGISIYSGNDALTEATKYFKYTYKFVDENGNVISENTVDYGTTITMPDAQPQKPATQQYTYTFAGWDGYTDGMTIEKDITFTAKYNATINKYTYKFIDDNGSLISEKTADYGTKIVAPSIPSKPATQKYTYTFAGWDGYTDGMTMEKDITFTAKYTATVNIYTYKFLNDNGSVVYTKAVEYGTKITLPSTPSKPATQQYTYTFAGWDGYTDGMTITEDITFTAKYTSTINKYTYKFVNIYGNVIQQNTVEYGTVITKPSIKPNKPATQQYTYTFAGWDGYTDGMTIENDITFTPKYTATVNKYTYTFYDENGGVIAQDTVDYGTKIVAPSNPSKPATQQYTYTFECWEGYTDGMTIEQDITFIAKFTETINKYTYRFVDDNGSVIAKDTVDYGTKITVPSSPSKPATQQYTYTFAGWDGYTDGMTIEEDITFTAKYTTTINKYTYTFVDENGSLISENTVDYGTEIIAPSNPSKPATQQYTYTFAGWEGYTDGMTIEKDITFTPTYTATINKYTYRFVDESGNVISEKTANYGTAIVAPSTPADKDPYTFERWEGYTYGMSITEDIIFTAVYKYKNYTINIDDISQPQVVTYNSSFTLPTQTRGDYNFMGYYTDKYGNGTKITDETGASLTVYNIVGDINVYPYFVSAYINKVVLTDDTTTIPGSTIKLNPTFATDKEASYLTVVISYPSELRYKKIKSLDYAEATVEENTSKDGYTYLDIICVYDYNGNSAPLNTKLIPFELEFEVTTDAPVGEISICVDEFYLIGNSDYKIDNIDNATINIQPKLAEHITIQGENTIEKSTKYYAVVYPDYTTNKNIVWSVDNENIATISVDGILTPVRNGNVTIIATAADGSGVYGTKTVSIVSYASIDSLDFGNGVVLTSFNPETRQYTVYVSEDAESITLTPVFTNGILRANGSGLWISGREKTFDLTSDTNVITLNRENVEGRTNCNYTITVVKYTGVKTDISEDGRDFTIFPINIADNTTVIIALYNESTLAEIHSIEYDGDIIQLSTDAIYTEAKIMVWDMDTMLKPMCKAEILK